MIKAHKGLGEKLTFNKSVLNSRQSAKKKKKNLPEKYKNHIRLKKSMHNRQKRHRTKKILEISSIKMSEAQHKMRIVQTF